MRESSSCFHPSSSVRFDYRSVRFGLLECRVSGTGQINQVQSNTPFNSAQDLSQTPLKIGYSASLTGMYSGQGKALVQGFQLWRDTVNKNNGLLGHPLVLDGLDDGSNPKQVTANYQKLTRNRVMVIL